MEHWDNTNAETVLCCLVALRLGRGGGEGLISAGAAGAVAAGATATTTAADRNHLALGSFGQGGEGGEHAPA